MTAAGDCSHEIKGQLLLGRKAISNIDSLLKSRDITFLRKVSLVKAVVFPVVVYGYECWTIKKAECWRIDVFELWCWRRLFRVPWTARRSNQSILKEISPEYSLEELMLKLKLQYFGSFPPDGKNRLIEKTLMLGKIEGRRTRWLYGITDLMDMSLNKLEQIWPNLWFSRSAMAHEFIFSNESLLMTQMQVLWGTLPETCLENFLD